MLIKYIPSNQILNINVNISDVSGKIRNYFMPLSDETINKLIDKCDKDLKSGLRIFLVGELRNENLEIIVDGKLNCISAINETDAVIAYCSHFDIKYYPPIVVYEIVEISSRFPDNNEIIPTREARKIFELRDSIIEEKQKLESLKKEFNEISRRCRIDRENYCHTLRVKSGYYDKKE